jgi:hypothetical protein
MMGEPGIYLVYRILPSEERGEERRLVGRFALIGDDLKVLEDHDGIVERIFPPGKLTGRILRRMESMEDGQSPYWRIYREADVQAGHHAELVPELKLGPEPWPAKE